MEQAINSKLVQTFEKLFISSKQSRIEQQSNGSYYFMRNGLSKTHILEHLKGTRTVGVFSGEVFSKYLCLDVDTGKFKKSKARNDVSVLLYALISEFDIPREYITVADSGNKGYHIYLFFDEVIQVDYLKAFYYELLERTNYDTEEVEFRPTGTQGVKLPLGIHKVTGRRCYFVDPYSANFKKLPISKIYDIKQLDTAMFKSKNNLKDLYEVQEERIYLQLCKFMYDDEARRFVGLCKKLDFTEYQLEHAETDIIKILKNKQLIYSDSRNKYTLLLAIYLKQQGHDTQEVERLINEVMMNSKHSYHNLVNSSESHIKRETKKIVKYVFKTNVSISAGNKTISLYRDEIIDILALGNVTLMKLYLSLIVHAKRHQSLGADSFYMAYSVMTNYGNAQKRSTLLKYLYKLQELGRIDIISHGIKDHMRSEIEGKGISKTNVYRIKKSFNQTPDEKVLIKADVTSVDIDDILTTAYKNNIVSFAELKTKVPKNRFVKFKQSL